MKLIAVTQRVSIVASYAERRDCLDQAWPPFLAACDLLPLALPNSPEVALALCDALPVAGLLLTGGNDLEDLGGDAPERDATERAVLDAILARALPVLGICRGMQLIQHRAGIRLHAVDGHVAARQTILVDGVPTEANSYHRYGTAETCAALEVWARAADGVVKAVRDRAQRITGIMWHPERERPFAAGDVALVRNVFGCA